MKARKLTWLMGGLFAMTAGALTVAACSEDSAATDIAAKKKDAGKGTDDTSSDKTDDTGSTTTDDTATDLDAGVVKKDAASTVSCSKTVASIHAPTSLYCPFQAKLSDGGFAPNCEVGATCCLQDFGKTSVSSCVARGAGTATCPTDTSGWDCSDNSQCGGKKCCLGVADAMKYDGGVQIGPKTGCPANDVQAFNESRTACKASCGAGEVEVTQTCSSGTVTAFKAQGLYDLAYCKP